MPPRSGQNAAAFKRFVARLFRNDFVSLQTNKLTTRFIMKRILVTPPARVEATVQLPSSKSICNRVLILHALAKGNDEIRNLSDCDDTQVMRDALRDMPPVIDIKAAGTAMRFLTAYLSVTEGTHVLTGTARMRQRPIKVLADALRTLGADIRYAGDEGFPPLEITGRKLAGNAVSLPGDVSSQYVSALLMIGPVLENGLRLTLTGEIVSRPYINLTLELMREFGAQAGWVAENCIEVASRPYVPRPYFVESDWSAASYWYEIAALSGDARIVLPGLFESSFQGDAKVSELFERLGVHTSFRNGSVVLEKRGAPVARMEYDFVNQPDLAQTFVVTCAMLDVPFRFSGLQSLKIKETDRIAALIAEMRKLGFVLTETGGSVLSWDGTRCKGEPYPAIDTYEDHRMAMSFAPAALKLKELRVNHPEVVSKSYPRYWENLSEAGFNLTEE